MLDDLIRTSAARPPGSRRPAALSAVRELPKRQAGCSATLGPAYAAGIMNCTYFCIFITLEVLGEA